jgi:hypothetical protein
MSAQAINPAHTIIVRSICSSCFDVRCRSSRKLRVRDSGLPVYAREFERSVSLCPSASTTAVSHSAAPATAVALTP